MGVFSFNHAWNEFLFALVFTSSEHRKTLAARPRHLDRAGQHLFLGHASGRCRASPIPVVYLLVQRKLVVGLSGRREGE